MSTTPVHISGLASGMDTESLISQLVSLQSTNLKNLQKRRAALDTQRTAYDTLSTRLGALQTAVDTLKSSATYNAKGVTLSDSTYVSATADSNAVPGWYDVQVIQRNTATTLTGTGNLTVQPSPPPATPATLDLTQKLDVAALNVPILGESDPVNPGLRLNTGSFSINGVEIQYDISQDTMASVLARINNSNAGVMAVYDKTGDRFVLTNKDSGAADITVSDGAAGSNFLTAIGVAGQTSVLGQQAKIQIAGFSAPLSSDDGTFTASETGIPGLAITIKKESTDYTRITVASDSSPVQKAVDGFITAYNSVTSYIADQSAITGSGSSKKVGTFNGDQSIQALSRNLRSMIAGEVVNPAGAYNSLSSVGVGTSGTAATLSVDASKLSDALSKDPNAVKSLFSDSGNGVMTKLSTFIFNQNKGAYGIIQSKDSVNDSAKTRMDTSIEREQNNVDAYEKKLRAQFTAMEQAINKMQSGLSQLFSNLG